MKITHLKPLIMKTTNGIVKIAALFIAFAFNSYTSFSRNVIGRATATKVTEPALPPSGFSNEYAIVNGVKIHYVIGGHGTPLIAARFPDDVNKLALLDALLAGIAACAKGSANFWSGFSG
jgi:hypothetical protein